MAIWNRNGAEVKNRSQSSDVQVSMNGVVSVNLEVHKEIVEQMGLIGLSKEDWVMAKKIGDFITTNVEGLVEFVYGKLGAQAGLVNIITSNSSLQKHMNILKHHLLDIFGGDIDDAFVERRIRVAHVHVKIGLEIRYYVAAMQVLVNGIIDVAQKTGCKAEDILAIVTTATKLLNLEMQLVLHFYEVKIKEERESIKNHVTGMASELAALSMQTSASVQEVVAHTGSASSNSQRGTELADTAKLRVEDGLSSIGMLLESLTHVRDGMQKITLQISALEDNTSKVQDIASWVKDIADQTNLLSLNASIEAARAGEHGRGFAVVASEVKKLAQQSSRSVDSITELIQGTIVEVDGIAESIRGIDQFAVEIQDKSNSVEYSFHIITQSIESNRDMNGRIEDDLEHLLKVLEEIGKANETIAVSSEKLDDFMKGI